MSPFIETIQIKDRKLQHIAYHNRRFNTTRFEHYHSAPIHLEELIVIPETLDNSVYRCRISYGKDIDKIEFIAHHPRVINTLKIVHDNDIDYHYKFSDRSKLDLLYTLRGECDDILIVRENMITDTWTANILFFDGNQWFTPTDSLLKGTHRMRLLDEGHILEKHISLDQIMSYQSFRLINALMDGSTIRIENIKK